MVSSAPPALPSTVTATPAAAARSASSSGRWVAAMNREGASPNS